MHHAHACRVQRRASDPLVLVLERVESRHVGAEDSGRVLTFVPSLL